MMVPEAGAGPRVLARKVCLLGDFAVGKTSLVDRLVHNRFEAKYVSTIGVRVSQKSVAVPQASELVMVNLMLWDLAGSEEFDRVRQSYLRGAAGGLLVCDLTRAETLERLAFHAAQARQAPTCGPLVILANKADLAEERAVSPEQVAQAAQALDAPWFLTSAKTADGVVAAFRELARRLVPAPGGA